jgi:hypothetical protein
MVVELAGGFWVRLHEFEEMKVCLEAALESAFFTVGWVFVAVFLELRWESEDTGCDAICPFCL